MNIANIEDQLKALPGFKLLRELQHIKEINSFIGRVEGYSQPKSTAKRDMQCHIMICDPSEPDPKRALLVQFYMPSMDTLPRVYTGCIMVLERFKLMSYRGYLQAWSNNTSRWHVYDANGTALVSAPGGKPGEPLSPAVGTYVKNMANWFKVQDGRDPNVTVEAPMIQKIAPSTMKRGVATIKEFEEKKFYDLYAYIVKTYSARENAFELLVTDYTENGLLHDYEYGTAGKWPGPFGKKVMNITLWDSFATFGREKLHEDMFVLLRNVHTSFSQRFVLEGNVREDPSHPDRKIAILGPLDPGLKNMKVRQVYDRKRFEERRVTLERERLAASLVAKLEKLPEPSKLNQNISTSHQNVPITAVGEILVPLQALDGTDSTGPGKRPQAHKYRTVGRMIDFWPADLRDFCQPFCYVCSNTFQPAAPRDLASHAHCTLCDAKRDKDDSAHYEFAFTTLLEGHDGECLPVIWSGNEVEALLDDTALEACNLYDPANARILSMLKERLFLFWGPLQEAMAPLTTKKRKQHPEITDDEMPMLEVCVMEYHVTAALGQAGRDGRRFKGFGTRILHGSSTSRVRLACGPE
jgi:hypothetical protein